MISLVDTPVIYENEYTKRLF